MLCFLSLCSNSRGATERIHVGARRCFIRARRSVALFSNSVAASVISRVRERRSVSGFDPHLELASFESRSSSRRER